MPTWSGDADFDATIDDERATVADALGDHAGGGTIEQGYYLGSLTRGLVAYYPLDDGSGSTATDKTELGNDGTINGATWVGSGQVGSDSLSFDGSDDDVDVPDLSLGSTESFSISAYVYFNSSGTDDGILGRYDGTDDILFFYKVGDDSIKFRAGHAGGSEFSFTTDPSFNATTGVWYHTAGVWDAPDSTARIYVDGVEEATSSTSISDFAVSNGPSIGSRGDGIAHMDGRIDDLRVYDRALSQPEIEALANRTITSTVTPGDTL